MRLLNVRTLQFATFTTEDTPPYIIVSHRWGDNEATFENFKSHKIWTSEGYMKVKGFCDFIRKVRPDTEWLWLDSCCIDKRDTAEVAKAINSMFRWYRNAVECFAYLRDVESLSTEVDSEFARSVWFKQCSLSEPKLSVIGHKSGTLSLDPAEADTYRKSPLNQAVSSITHVPLDVLHDISAIKRHPVREVMSWARYRKTKEPEDETYSMLGLFGVFMPLILGESRESARARLAEAISRKYANDVTRELINISPPEELVLSDATTSDQPPQDSRHRSRDHSTMSDQQVPGSSSGQPDRHNARNASSTEGSDYIEKMDTALERWYRDAKSGELFQYRAMDGELYQVYQSGRTASRGSATREALEKLMSHETRIVASENTGNGKGRQADSGEDDEEEASDEDVSKENRRYNPPNRNPAGGRQTAADVNHAADLSSARGAHQGRSRQPSTRHDQRALSSRGQQPRPAITAPREQARSQQRTGNYRVNQDNEEGEEESEED
ncbi:uncharacterized protein LTR77_009353 [Saxophila tyrrhenica]|uniref:Heterokaryon incompatibility domain-containing protein n=1 Tax=Saxophila tyrrhenica TaxID=1690608 RepID=A0AAV9P2N3_9PEZI|nr:hypothetical protein LTR77_009353 [Saxophila tyrrhenica]